jgi:hypothetical protein
LTLQKTSPTVLNNYEEITSKYILFTLLVSDEGTERIGMNLVQEELFVCSRTEKTKDSKVRQNYANIQNYGTPIAQTIIISRHCHFYLRGNYAIIGAGKMCSTGQGRMLLVSRPKNKRVIFFEKRSYTAKISGFSIL